MTEAFSTDSDELIAEIERYLAVVEAFRDADCEPTWQPELTAAAIEPGRKPHRSRIEKSAH